MEHVVIVPRSTWGALPWGGKTYSVAASARTHFFIHYDGGTPVTRTGYAIPRAIDAEHHAKGWNGIGYNFVVSQAGKVFEGRGWDLIGAHCTSWNTVGIGVQVAIGGDQQPTPAALHAVDALYAEACQRAGEPLTKTWHNAHFATECPGSLLVKWVQTGMPDPLPSVSPEDPVAAIPVPMFAQATRDAILAASWGHKADGTDYTLGDLLVEVRDGTRKTLAGLAALGQQVAGLDQRVADLERRLPVPPAGQ